MADLILAAKRGILSKVLSELREGVPVDFQDEEQATALYWACCSGNQEICQLLLDKHANPNIPVKWGSTALHAAADRGHMECMRLLLRYGVYVNAVNSSGDTALHLAAYRGRQDVCKLLIGHNADLSIVNLKGKTPQREAQAGEHMQLTLLLASKKTEHRPQSFPLENRNGEHIYHSAPLESKQLVDWDYAHRSASYPLDHTVHPENGHKVEYEDKKLGNDELKRRESLRREVLNSPVSSRQTTNNCQYMNQISQEERHDYHLQRRPFSDPTTMLHNEKAYIDTIRLHQSEPSKQGILATTPSEFQNRQREIQRHYNQTVKELQIKLEVLSTQKETLEKRLMQNLDEESKTKLEKRVKELMSEVQQERRDRSEADSKTHTLEHQVAVAKQQKEEADARNRQLATELFQFKSMPMSSSIATVQDSSLPPKRDDRNCDLTSQAKIHDSPCNTNEESGIHKQFASNFCQFSGRAFLNSSPDLQHVCSGLLDDQSSDGRSLLALKTGMCQKLEHVVKQLRKRAAVTLNYERGQVLKKNEDYTFVDDKPIDTRLNKCEDGISTEILYRINCQSKTANMKVIINHSRAPSMSDDVHFGTEWEILNSITPHANITRILHWFSQPVVHIKDNIASSHNSSLGPLPKDVATFIMPEYVMSLETLGTICPSAHVMNERCLLRILLELSKAVYYLKTNGIVHRDIEPSKVFLDRNFRVVIGDFGLARIVVNDSNQPIPFVEKSQVVAGNQLAWAPELLQFNKDGPPKSYQKPLTLVDVYEASDMYTIAATLCHVINKSSKGEERSTGFHSGSQLLVNQSQVPSCLSDEAQTLLRGMVKENPRDRPTLQEVILRVSRLLFGPQQGNIQSQSDCEAWIHAQLLRLLAVAPSTQTRTTVDEEENLELARTAEWILCYEYVTSVTSLQLWELCQE